MIDDIRAKRNVRVLVAAQAILGAQMPMIFLVGGLAGQSLATNICFATLPISMIVLGSMLAATPVSAIMQRFGRKAGFFLGAAGGAAGALIAAYGLWNDVQRQTMNNQMLQLGNGQIAVPRQADGHYYLSLAINGENIRFVVDTGATNMVLTRDDARRAGLEVETLNFIGTANTANGTVRTAPVRLNTVRLGDITDTDVYASVNGGAMDGSLLGMGYLEKWGRIEISGGELRLTR